MEILQTFFRKTGIFWITSRLLLALSLGYCGFFLLEGADVIDYFTAGFFFLYAVAMFWVFTGGLFQGGVNRWFKIFTGSVSIIFGILIICSTASVFGTKAYTALILLPVWFLLAGIYDLLDTKRIKKAATEEVPGIADPTP